MSVIRTTPDKVGKLLDKRAKASRGAVRRAALAAAHRGKTMIRHHTPSDLGQMSKSWRVVNQRRGKGKTGLSQDICELLNDAPHAGVVESGARPHKVSPEGWWSIYEWVERHFPDAADEGGGLDAYGNDPGFSRITWAIVRKIGREGQKPTHFVRDKMPVFMQIAHKEISHAIASLAAKGKA